MFFENYSASCFERCFKRKKLLLSFNWCSFENYAGRARGYVTLVDG
jgi:hypothetical protein